MLTLSTSLKRIAVAASARNALKTNLRDRNLSQPVFSQSFAASPVFVVAEDDSPPLVASASQWEKSASLLQTVLRRKKLKTHCGFNTVKLATELLDQCNMLDEFNARLLISTCGKSMNYFDEQKSLQAQLIFNKANTKSIDLANELLKVLVENSMPSDPKHVLKRLDESSLAPNENTFLQLIAGACVSGDIHFAKNTLQLCWENGFEVPPFVYGYFAYGLGKAGKTEGAMKLIDQFLIHDNKISWDVFSLFVRGVANSNIDLERVVTKYQSHLLKDLTVSHLLAINEDFWQYGKILDFNIFANYLPPILRLPNIMHASQHLSKYPFHVGAPLLRYLMSRSQGTMYLTSLVKPLCILVKHSLQSENFQELWETYLFLKRFNPDDNSTEFLVLSLLIEKDFCAEKFFVKLRSKEFEIPIPRHLLQALKYIRIKPAKIEHFLKKKQTEENDHPTDYQTTAC